MSNTVNAQGRPLAKSICYTLTKTTKIFITDDATGNKICHKAFGWKMKMSHSNMLAASPNTWAYYPFSSQPHLNKDLKGYLAKVKRIYFKSMGNEKFRVKVCVSRTHAHVSLFHNTTFLCISIQLLHTLCIFNTALWRLLNKCVGGIYTRHKQVVA